jgi:CubicO group peptidase (beta-lactamase class C family)
MRRPLPSIALAALVLASCARPTAPATPAAAAPTSAVAPTRVTPDLAFLLDARVHAVFDAQHLVGLTAAAGSARGFAWTKGYGLADVENTVPASPDTVYRFASVSKVITAVAALELAESGKLDLDAPIQRYVPTFPQKPWPITATHLLTHSSGIRHYKDDEPESTFHYGSLEAGLDRFKNEPLLHQPGAKYTYSSYGFNLLGRAVEGASGQPFVPFLVEHVFCPGGMTATRDDDVRAVIPHRAEGYDRTADGDLQNAELTDTSFKVPSGGLCGTAKDLVAFSLGVATHKLLKPETVARMLTVSTIGTPPVPNPDGFGLGWMIEKVGDHRVAYHTGSQPGASAIVYMLPDDGLAIALLSNLEGATLHPLAREMAQAMLDARQ